MPQNHYCDFPNGQRVHVFRLRDLVEYAEQFGSPVKVVTMNKKGNFSSPSYYDLVDGRMVKQKAGTNATTSGS